MHHAKTGAQQSYPEPIQDRHAPFQVEVKEERTQTKEHAEHVRYGVKYHPGFHIDDSGFSCGTSDVGGQEPEMVNSDRHVDQHPQDKHVSHIVVAHPDDHNVKNVALIQFCGN